jgi:stress-induced-phosphoprotein 1
VNALADADRCIEISSSWAKGHGRKGAALHQLKRYHEAIEAYELGLSHVCAHTVSRSALTDSIGARRCKPELWIGRG